MKRKVTLFCAVALLWSVVPQQLRATIHNVPASFPTIQAAIANPGTVTGDTVLVAPGTYVGNINFLGKNILVASNFIFTGNQADITNAVIDGNNAGGSLIRFVTGEVADARLVGFTVRRGLANATTTFFGGGIFINGASPTLQWLRIETCLANITGGGGGGVFMRNSNATMDHCIVRNNRGFRGGGISVWENSSPQITNCLVHNNTANEFGGGMEVRFHNHPNLRISNCTFANNLCSPSAVNGGGALAMRNNGAAAFLSNCILWGNTSPQISATTGNAQFLTLTHCDVQGGQSGQQLQIAPNLTVIWGPANIDQNPLFLSSTDFHLNPASPCLETGNNIYTTATAQDLDNTARIQDADNNGTATVDMGPYEAQIAYCAVTALPNSLPTVQLTTRLCGGEITVCGDQAYVRTRVYNNGPVAIDSLIFTPTLPPGVTYVPGTASVNVGNPFVVQNLSQPRFAVYFSTGLPVGGQVILTYAIKAGCDLIPFAQTGNPFILPMTLRYRELPTGNFNIVSEVNPISFNVRFADLVITQVINLSTTGNVGDIFVRTIKILNGGNGSLSQFQMQDSSDNGITILGIGKPAGNGGSITGSNVSFTLNSADFLANPHLSSNGNTSFDPGEYIFIYDTVKIMPTCDTADTKFTVNWGCFSENCVAQGDFEFSSTILGQGGPNFQVTEVGGTYVPTNYCSGDTGHITYRYRNIGPEQFPGAARAMNVRMVYTSTYTPSSLVNFRIGTFSLASITVPAGPGGTHTIDFRLLTVDPDGPGGMQDLDGDGRYDDMLKNAFVDITADILMTCPANFNACQASFDHYIAYPRVTYENQCYRPMGTRYGPYRRVIGGTTCIPTVLGPTELGDGQVGTYTFTHHYPMSGLANLDCNNRRARMLVNLPAGLSIVPGSVMVNNHLAPYTQLGSLVTITGDSLMATGGTLVDDIYSQLFTVQLEMDCDAPGVLDVSVLSWKQTYQCDTTCACIIGAGCSTINIKNLCICEAPVVTTKSFDTERTTFGWTNSHRTTFVNRNTPGLRLDRLYECDSLQAVAKGVVLGAAADSVGVVISYVAPGNDTLLIPGSAYVVVVDSITGMRDTCPVTPVLTKVSNSPHTYSVDYAAFGCGSPLTQGDSIILVATFDVKKTSTLPDHSNYEIPCFTATHYTIDNGDQLTCDTRGKRMYVLKSEVETAMETNTAHTFVSSCNTIERRLKFRADGGACETDEFPNEFRNLYRIQDTVVFTLPNGYEYVPNTSRFTRESEAPLSYALPDPIIVGNTLTYIASSYPGSVFPDGRWPLQDKVGHTASDIFFQVRATCDPADTTVHDNAFYSYTDYDFAEDPACFDSIFDIYSYGSLVHTHPNIDVTGFQSSITVLGSNVTWGIEICNNLINPTDVEGVELDYYTAINGWLAISNPSGVINLVSVTDTTDSLPFNVPFINTLDGLGNPIILINADTINALTCRFLVLSANTVGCLPQDVDGITISAGWSCGPINVLPDPGCIQDTTLFYFYQKEADLRATAEAPTDNVFQACEPAEYILTVSSSQLGTMHGILVDVVLPTGMVMVPDSASFLYPMDSTYRPIGDPDSLGFQTYRFVIDSIDSMILVNGLTGVADLIRNKFKLKFEVTTDCDYTSGSVLQFFVSGYTNCDSLIIFAFQTDPQYVEGAEPEYAMQLQLNTQGFRSCSNTTRVEVVAYNHGPNPVTANDSVQVLVPAGLSYVAGSFIGVTNFPTNPVPVATAAPGGTLLSWELNAGMAMGNYSAFTIDLLAAGALPCEDIAIVLSTNFKDTVVCLLTQDSTCFMNGISGQDTFAIPVFKDLYMLSNFVADVGCSTTTASIVVQNVGAPTSPSQTVEFYCDADGSGTLTPGDVLMGSGSHVGSLIVGGSATISVTLNDYCESNMIAVMRDDQNCICATLTLTVVPNVDPQISPADADFTFVGGCASSTIAFTSATNAPSAQHQWDFGDGGTSTLANPTHSFVGTPPFTVTHIVVDTCRTDTVVKIVTFDATPPTITCPPSLTVACDADTTPAATGTAATEPGAALTHQDSVALGTCPVVATIYRTWTATDSCGNAASCTQVISLMDSVAPTISCPAPISVANDLGLCGATVSFAATASDACGTATVTYSPAAGGFFPVGTTSVTATASDPCGNTATCTFTVTVTDVEPPQALCSSATVYLDGTGAGTITSATIDGGSTDNCGIASMSLSATAFDCADLGTQSVVLTVVDIHGNSSACTATVTVVDSIAPSITCPADVSVACVQDLPAPDTGLVTATDNCTVVSIAHVGDVATGTGCAGDPRIVVRTYVATDQSGNSSTCMQTLTAEATPVVATASSDTYVFPAYQDSACVTISVTGSGGCAPYTYQWSNGPTTQSQTVCPTVSTTYTVTVTDAQGCTGIDTVRVCVIDLVCTDRTNNGQTGNGQGGNGTNQSPNAMTHITICHVPPGHPQNAMTQCLPVPAALQHILLGHGGDYLGSCGSITTRPCTTIGNAKTAVAAAVEPQGAWIQAFPNPTDGMVSLALRCTGCGEEGSYVTKVTDMYGKVVLSTRIDVVAGEGSMRIDLSQHAAGVYMIAVEVGDERLMERVVKQ
jgi:uncharacterized repeat protein (TIGR01451 family)